MASLSRRFQIVAAAATLSDAELSASARSQGLHVDQIKQYRRDCLLSDVLIAKPKQDRPLESGPWRSSFELRC